MKRRLTGFMLVFCRSIFVLNWINFLLIPPELLCAQENHFSQNLEIGIVSNAVPKRIVFEKTIVVHDHSAKLNKIKSDKIGAPDTVYPSLPSSIIPPHTVIPNGIAKNVRSELIASRISHLLPKNHPKVDAMDNQIDEDRLGRLVPNYIHPPFVSKYSQADASNIIDEADFVKRTNEFTKKNLFIKIKKL